MNIEKLKIILKGEPAFRLKQAWQAIFNDLITDWNQAMTLPAALRLELEEIVPLKIDAKIINSEDGCSSKALITLSDGLKIETVLLNHINGRHTVCVSSQVGCALGCLFCATGAMGFRRNLMPGEIVEQVLLWARFLKPRGEKVASLVFMGMGEPFLNYENVLSAIKILNDKHGLNIGARHISVSTVGVSGGIKKIAKEKMQINLAWSLHASNDDLRSKIIPINRSYSIEETISDLNDYLKQTGRRVMIEYLMIDGLNDSKEQALELANILKMIDPPLYFVNLIVYNPTADFRPTPEKRIKEFRRALNKQGIEVTERYRLGREIKAACGQLAGRG